MWGRGAHIADRPLLAGVKWFKIVLSLSVAIFTDELCYIAMMRRQMFVRKNCNVGVEC